MEALSVATGKVLWATKLKSVPLGAATVSNDLLFTTLEHGTLVALNRRTGAIVYQTKRCRPTTNAPIAIAGRTIIVPAGGPTTSSGGGDPQMVAYRAR